MESEIIALEEKLRFAMLTSDVNSLDELIADSLFFTAPTGELITKEMDINVHKSGIQKVSKLELIEQKIGFYTNFAVVAAKMQLEGKFGNEQIDGIYCYTRVWAKLQNHWQVVSGHVSKSLV